MASRLRKAIEKDQVNTEDEAELMQMLEACIRPPYAERVLQEVQALGRLPQRRKHPVGDDQIAENALARKLRVLQRRLSEKKREAAADHGAAEAATDPGVGQTTSL